ncbi:hypothetical protein, partial [Pseudomonas aeruginosa]
FSANENAKSWLKTQNNFIGFCVGVKSSYDELSEMSAEEFGEAVEKFDTAFRSIDAAKVNLGKYRRELSKKYVEKISELKDSSDIELLSYFSDETTA